MNLHPSLHAKQWDRRVLTSLSGDYPRVWARFDTRYAPVRRSPSGVASYSHAAPRLACVKPVASVHPEPGSNSPLYIFYINVSVFSENPRSESIFACI